MSIHYSIGLCPEGEPRCRVHGERFMEPFKDRYRIHTSGGVLWAERIIWKCRAPDCHVVCQGEHDYVKSFWEKRMLRAVK